MKPETDFNEFDTELQQSEFEFYESDIEFL